MHSEQSVERYSLEYEEFDALIGSIDGRTTLTGRVKQDFRIDRLSMDGLSLDWMQEGGANLYEGEAQVSGYSVAIGMPSNVPIHANDVPLDPEHMVLFRRGDTATSFSRDVSRYTIINFSADLFAELLEQADPNLAENILSGPCSRHIRKEDWSRTVTKISRAHDRIGDEDFLTSYSLQKAALMEIAQSYVDTLVRGGARTSATGRPRMPRKEIMARALEALHSTSYFRYSVKEMARYAGVGERMFRTVCTERLGVSPKKYIMLRQMHDIRTELSSARPGDRVSRIAAKFGVWDWGRFSVRYRLVYGEKPSETLARSVMESA